jgi:two-component system chemotaxis response regulator CheY
VDAWDASQARTALKQGNIALMFCDLNIPGVNGLDLVEAMRKEPTLAELPVVMMTVERGAVLMERAKRAGVSEWITKPFDAATLLTLSERLAGPAVSGS